MKSMQWLLGACALAVSAFLPAHSEAQSDWKYVQMTGPEGKGVVCRELGTAGLALRRAKVDSKRVLIVMAGGASCQDAESCKDNPKQFTKEDFEREQKFGQSLQSGVFFRDSAKNTFKDDHHAFVPYCSGDMHGGARDTKGIFGVPEQHFHGYKNAELYFKEIIREYDSVLRQPGAQVVLLGVSAGGFGAQFNAPQLKSLLPSTASLVLVSDSGPLYDQQVTGSCMPKEMANLYNFKETFLKNCPTCTESGWVSEWQDYLLANHSTMPQALLSSIRDSLVQTLFSRGWPGCEKTALSVNTMQAGLRSIRERMQKATTRYGTPTATFYVDDFFLDWVHTFVTQYYYYTPVGKNAVNQSVALPDWFRGLNTRKPTPLDHVGFAPKL